MNIANKMVDVEAVKEQYKTVAGLEARIRLHNEFTVEEEPFYLWVFRMLQLEQGMKVLEVGCGTGVLWKKYIDWAPKGIELTLTDLSEGMIEATKAAIGEDHETKVDYAVCNVLDLPFEDQTFDLVIANHMLDHVPDLDGALQSIARVLKKDGVLVASTIGDDNMRELWALASEQSGGEIKAPALSFSMNNGEKILNNYFNHVERYIHAAHFNVTAVQPVIDYIESMITFKEDGSARENMAKRVQEKLNRDGSMYIRKTAGLFRAWRGAE